MNIQILKAGRQILFTLNCKTEIKLKYMVSFGVSKCLLLFKRGSMKNLVKVMFVGIIGASVLSGGIALAHGWAGEGYCWEHGGI